ncbi:bifunctional glutamine synthetase adenylyltransferase/deadenyltransferase [Rhodothalassium salexigens DSM 2132]|nr:bifunctional glutamine synthetase adenylyltransferase/deadenyltransferase [Rhodothalassium salexigens DSM 2132]
MDDPHKRWRCVFAPLPAHIMRPFQGFRFLYMTCPPAPSQPDRADEMVALVADTIAQSCDAAEPDAPRASGSLDPAARAGIAALAGNSPFLARLIRRDPAFMARVATEAPDALCAEMLETLAARAPEIDDRRGFMALLRNAKARLALLIAHADVTGAWDLARVTAGLSDFADLALDLAVAHLLRRAMRRGRLPWPDGREDAPATPALCRGSGYVVLALGKHGARELNYSSDIDLIVLWDNETVRPLGDTLPGDLFVRLTKDLVQIMEERTGEGYVFRTDLRLRPDPGSTPVALSMAAAETYYQSMALNWERAAHIKARPVAGDIAAGEAYLDRLRPFVWRKSIDYAALEDIHAIKDQVQRHYGARALTLPGFDVKLGPGGIREVEFYAQINQLLAGGRDPSLRPRATVAALDALVAAGRLAPAVRDELVAAYGFLRMVEHRVQMVDDQQTQSLPRDDAGLDRIALFAGFDDRAGFEAALLGHLRTVQAHYDALLPRGETPAGGDGLDTTRFADPDKAEQIVEQWRRSRYRCLRTDRARRLLAQVLPALTDALAATADTDRALVRFDAFLANLPAGVQIFSLFQAQPQLMKLIARLMGTAPALADTLAKRPALLDAVLDPGFYEPLADADALETELAAVLARAPDYEEALESARRWLAERRFQVGVHILEALTTVEDAAASLTDLADATLRALLPVVEAHYAERYGRIAGGGLAVIAMGKYGGRELSFTSDLDVVLVYRADDHLSESDGPRQVGPSRYFSGLGQALVIAVTAMTAEGRLYEMDTRLRPQGRQGPLAVHLTTLDAYYREDAWAWEHLALTRARIVTAPGAMNADLNHILTDALGRARDAEALRTDTLAMRDKLAKEFPNRSPWSPKHAQGGLLDMEFAVQYLVLVHAHAHPEVVSPNLKHMIERLTEIGALSADAAAVLVDAYRLQHAVQSVIRLCLDDDRIEADFSADLKAVLVKATGADDFDALSARLARSLEQVREIYDRILGVAA